MDSLYKFYISPEREIVKAYLLEHLSILALADAYNGKDTAWVSKAKGYVEDAFYELEKKVAPKEEKQSNQSSR